MRRPTFAEFVCHAQLFGTVCVYETAVELWPSHAADLILLRIELDAIEAEHKNGRYTVGKRRRRSEVETARYAWALARELGENRRGVERRIADKLGISDAYARRVLNLGRTMAETTEKAPRNPSRQAAKFATKPEPGTLPHPARSEA